MHTNLNEQTKLVVFSFKVKYICLLLFWLRKLPEYYFLAQAFANLHGKRRQGNLFKKQGFICYRPVNMIQQN